MVSNLTPADKRLLKTLGTNLAHARRQANLTQEDVGNHLGVNEDTVSRWERGVNDPGYTEVHKMAELYGVEVAWLSGTALHKTGLRPGYTIVNLTNLEILRAARRRKGTLRDLDGISAKPQADVAWEIPEHVGLLDPNHGQELHHEIRTAVDELRRNTP